jgi:hypothetical protein
MQCEEVREQLAADVANGNDAINESGLRAFATPRDVCVVSSGSERDPGPLVGDEYHRNASSRTRRAKGFNLMIEAYRHGLEQSSSPALWQG